MAFTRGSALRIHVKSHDNPNRRKEGYKGESKKGDRQANQVEKSEKDVVPKGNAQVGKFQQLNWIFSHPSRLFS